MRLTIETQVRAGIDRVWAAWTQAEEIKGWYFASDDWCCPAAEQALTPGGQFSYRMEAKDGAMGFDYCGEFTRVEPQEAIAYRLEDGREVEIGFIPNDAGVRVTQRFETESSYPVEQQRQGWQSILDNFKAYVEKHSSD